MRSIEVLALTAQQAGRYLLDELGAPHRDDLKLRTVTVKTSEGRDVAQISGDASSEILDDLIRGRFVYEAVPLDEKYRRVYRLTPAGFERGRLFLHG
jgi:hypothetical protein